MQHGTTSIFPTLSSSTIPMIRAAAATTEKLMAEKDSPYSDFTSKVIISTLKWLEDKCHENPDRNLLEETNCIKRWDAAPEPPEQCSSENILHQKVCRLQ